MAAHIPLFSPYLLQRALCKAGTEGNEEGLGECQPAVPGSQAVQLWDSQRCPRGTSEHPPVPCPSAAVCPLPTAWLKLWQLQRLSCTLVLSRANRTVLRVWVWALSRAGDLVAGGRCGLLQTAVPPSFIFKVFQAMASQPVCSSLCSSTFPTQVGRQQVRDGLWGGGDPLQLTWDELGVWQELAE